jgi:hypothetical protein
LEARGLSSSALGIGGEKLRFRGCASGAVALRPWNSAEAGFFGRREAAGIGRNLIFYFEKKRDTLNLPLTS